MIYYDQHIEGMRIVVWHVTEDYEELLSLLPDPDSVRYEAESKFSSDFRRVEWTAVRVLLFTVLDRQLHINYNEHGAPLLPDYEGLNISISHTKGYVAIALSETTPVGVDVEQIEITNNKEMNLFADKHHQARVEKVRDRFIRPDETANTIIDLLLHWSAKESVYKVLGREGVDFIEDLKISKYEYTPFDGQFQLVDLKEDDNYNIYYKVFDDFVLTFTAKKNG